MMDEPTVDPSIRITHRGEGLIRYQHVDGRRWEVRGVCDHRGDCLVGAVIDGEFVETQERAHELALAYDGPDVPVGPGFSGCCPLEVTEL